MLTDKALKFISLMKCTEQFEKKFEDIANSFISQVRHLHDVNFMFQRRYLFETVTEQFQWLIHDRMSFRVEEKKFRKKICIFLYNRLVHK